MRHILGISAYYHDSAAALVRDGEIVAAAQEERFSRKKNDERFPHHAIQFCLRRGGLTSSDLDAVVFYDKPITKFARSLETWLSVAPGGFKSFLQVMPSWLSERLNLRKTIREELAGLSGTCEILFAQHHQSHAASAFYPSPFNEAAILTIDGVGEYATTTIGRGIWSRIEILEELRFPHSLGLLYSAFTAYCGFRVNSGEYKLMGLAPYGEPKYASLILDQLIDLKRDGSFKLNLDYFGFLRGVSLTNGRFHRLFGGAPRRPDSPLETRHMDVACSIQVVTGEVMRRLARHARDATRQKNLCLAGGVALNCVANGAILREKIFENIWIQPAAGDAGGALGAALAVWNSPSEGVERKRESRSGDAMQGALLGPEFTEAEIETALRAHGAVYTKLGEEALIARVAEFICQEKVVGWFQGRMEFGPRALGNRSILGDARSPKMQSVMNRKIKFRESFRPFAPVVRFERVADYFDLDRDSPYMLLVAPVREAIQSQRPEGVTGLDLLRHPLSSIPAVTHVDYSSRIQTVTRQVNPRLYRLLEQFEKASGCGVLVNTSFNVRGEPIVCTPDDAYRCFVGTEMDYLVVGDFLLERMAQPRHEVGRHVESLPDCAMRPRLKEDPKEWIKFIAVATLALGVASGLLWKRAAISGDSLAAVLTLLGLVLMICVVRPRWFRPLYRLAMTASFYVGQVAGRILMGIVFIMVLTPMAICLRIMGKDLLGIKQARTADTYWRPAQKPSGFDRQF